ELKLGPDRQARRADQVREDAPARDERVALVARRHERGGQLSVEAVEDRRTDLALLLRIQLVAAGDLVCIRDDLNIAPRMVEKFDDLISLLAIVLWVRPAPRVAPWPIDRGGVGVGQDVRLLYVREH